MKTYVIARMYAGSYLEDNLGGEAINLLHDDHNNNYIFVGPYGFINPKYDDTVEAIVLTRLYKNGVFEILGIALTDKNSQVTYRHFNKRLERIEECKKELDEYASLNDIRYGGVSLKDIHGGKFDGADITFKSVKLLLPKISLFITDSHHQDFKIEGERMINLEDVRFSKTSMVQYVTDKNNSKSYSSIEDLISDDSLWKRTNLIKLLMVKLSMNILIF